MKNVSSNLIVKELMKMGHKNSFLFSKKQISENVNKIMNKNDIIISMGAGDIYQTLDEIYKNMI